MTRRTKTPDKHHQRPLDARQLPSTASKPQRRTYKAHKSRQTRPLYGPPRPGTNGTPPVPRTYGPSSTNKRAPPSRLYAPPYAVCMPPYGVAP